MDDNIFLIDIDVELRFGDGLGFENLTGCRLTFDSCSNCHMDFLDQFCNNLLYSPTSQVWELRIWNWTRIQRTWTQVTAAQNLSTPNWSFNFKTPWNILQLLGNMRLIRNLCKSSLQKHLKQFAVLNHWTMTCDWLFKLHLLWLVILRQPHWDPISTTFLFETNIWRPMWVSWPNHTFLNIV